jgi:type I restriction enzyme, R subunit
MPYGVTWNASRRFMARWKEQGEDTYKFAVQSFFEPTDLLRTLRHCILFYVEDGETRKSVLRQHQRIAIGKIVLRCEDVLRRSSRAATRDRRWRRQSRAAPRLPRASCP